MKRGLARAVRSDIAVHSALLFVVMLVLNIANYGYYALAGRLLSISDYGILMSLLSLLLVITAPAMVAQNSLGKLVADVLAGGNAAAVAGLSRSTQRFASIAAATVFVIGIVLQGPISALVHARDPVLVPLAAAAVAGAIVVPLQRGVFQGAGRFGELALSMLLEGVVRLATVVPLARVAGIRGALGAMALSLFAPALSSALRSRAIWPHAELRALDLRRVMLAALKTGTGFLALTTMLYFDVILVRYYFDSNAAGLYSEVSLLGRAIFTGVAFVPMIVIPKIVARRASRASIRPIVALAVGVMAVAAACAICIVAIAPAHILSIVGGPAFQPAAPYLLPYACAASALAAANVAVSIRVGLHRFSHVAPLLLVAGGEVVAVAVRHHDISEVLWVIVIGHSLALAVMIAVTVFEPVSAGDQGSPLPARTISLPE